MGHQFIGQQSCGEGKDVPSFWPAATLSVPVEKCGRRGVMMRENRSPVEPNQDLTEASRDSWEVGEGPVLTHHDGIDDVTVVVP